MTQHGVTDEHVGAIERERRQFRDLFKAAQGAYLVTDRLGLIRQASDQAYQLLGVDDPRLLLGRPLRTFVDLGDQRTFAITLDALVGDGEPRRWPVRLVPEHGPALTVTAHAFPLLTGDGPDRWSVRWLLIPVDLEAGLTPRLAKRGFIYEMADALGIGAYVADADGVCVYANRRTEQILGQRLVGRQVADWRQQHEHRPSASVGEGDQAFERYSIVRPDGTQRWVAHGVHTLRDHQGDPDGFVATLADVTDVAEAEERTLEANERLEGILAQASDAIISADEDQNIILFNRAAETVLGYRASDVLGQPLRSILPDEVVGLHEGDLPRFDDHTAVHRLMGGARYVQATRSTGEPFAAEVSISVGTVLSKRVYVVILRDASEQVAAAEQILRADRRYRAVFDQSLVGVLVVDAAGVVIDANDAFCELVGRAATAVRGQGVAHMQHEQAAAADRSAQEASLAEGSAGYRLADQRYLHADGSFIWTNVAVSSVRDPEGEATYLVYLIDDVTARHELEAQLHHAQRIELAAQLGSGLAHDLNNVLAVLRGQLELLGDEIAPGPQTAKRLAAAQHAVDRASDVATGLLRLSRKPEYAPQTFDLNDLVRSVSDLTSDLLGGGIALQVELDATEPLVLADPHQIEQVLISLVVNARDAMPGGGSLTISTSDSDRLGSKDEPAGGASSALSLAVVDSGIGMDAGTRAQVFTPFFTTKPAGSGTGLGLSQALQAVRQARGLIDIDSRPGCGATFTVTLPRAPAPAPAPSSDRAATLRPDAAGRGHGPGAVPTILVVDDEADVLEVVTETLVRAGYQVLACTRAKDAAACFASRTDIDLVLTDVVMAGESGLALAARFHAQRPWIPVVVTSAYFDETIDRDALEWSLDKPFTSAALLDIVSGALGGSAPVDETLQAWSSAVD
ncbi:PAS domain S-box protein [Aquihabitans sp. McL0605]|uniref:PAS domain-containing sensor histidine kinase n=1 Tax=Aquihabitans sp. McL0605 TaxID=3415671 RepID=UPI003CF4A233